MSTSRVIQVAAAVTARLNEMVFLLAQNEIAAPVAERCYVPLFDLKTLGVLRISVVAKARALTPRDRSHENDGLAVDIGIQKKIDQTQMLADCDALMNVCEQVVEHFRRINFDTLNAKYEGISNEPIYSVQKLSEDSVFLGIITVRYRISW